MNVRLLLALSVGLLFLPQPARAQSFEAEVDALVAPYVEDDRFMGTILLAREGQILYKKSFGYAHRQLGYPNTNETRYRLGSITKATTAVGIMRLVEWGLLDLDQTIDEFLPICPDYWRSITVRHLLQNTSGIPDYLEPQEVFGGGYDPLVLTWQFSGAHVPTWLLLWRIQTYEKEWEPGSSYNYSNSNWVILAQIIEAVTWLPYELYTQWYVLGPAGMTHANLSWPRFQWPFRQRSYFYYGPDAVEETFYVHPSLYYGNGDVVSNVDDLYNWSRAMTNGTLLNDDSLDEMYTGSQANPIWGLGAVIYTTPSGKRIIRNGGQAEGYGTTIIRFLDDDAVIIILGNLVAVGDTNSKPINETLPDIIEAMGLELPGSP
jgi:CubicO group peptidase (beta-lactamase class C family)